MEKSDEGITTRTWHAIVAVWAAVATLVTALTLLLISGPVAAQSAENAAEPPAGIIVSAQGDTSLLRTGQVTSPAGRLQQIYSGDRLKTGENGRISLRFSDGMRMNLGPASQFHIDDFNDRRGEERSFFSLIRGKLRTITGLMGKSDPASFRLQTPTAVIGVRGTDFTVVQADCARTDCNAPDAAPLEVAVTQGAVDVGNQAGSLLVHAGQRARVGTRSSPELIAQAAAGRPASRPAVRPPARPNTTPAIVPATPAAARPAPAPRTPTRDAVRRRYESPAAGEFFAPRN